MFKPPGDLQQRQQHHGKKRRSRNGCNNLHDRLKKSGETAVRSNKHAHRNGPDQGNCQCNAHP